MENVRNRKGLNIRNEKHKYKEKKCEKMDAKPGENSSLAFIEAVHQW